MDLRWIASQSASCFHAAEALFWGKALTDPAIAESISGPVTNLRQQIEAPGLSSAEFWRHLIPLAAGIEDNRELAAVLVRKLIGSTPAFDSVSTGLAECFTALENAYRDAVPELVDELAARARPLREHWEARGPGLLRAIGRLTDERLVVERADLVLVRPVLSGMAVAHLAYNSVRMEAVLANPLPNLPETVRLAWALAQLNLDLPVFSDSIHRHRLPLVGQLAMLPVALTAAEHVELATCDDSTLRLALQTWLTGHATDLQATEDNLAGQLTTWYAQYNSARPDWTVALTALDRMLSP